MKFDSGPFAAAAIFWTQLVIGLSATLGTTAFGASADEWVTFYPTCGNETESHWVLPVHAWVHEDRSAAETAAVTAMRSTNDFTAKELIIFRKRIRDFVADSESREVVTIQFDADPAAESFSIIGPNDRSVVSDNNGEISGQLRLTKERASQLAAAQGRSDSWLTFSANSDGHTGTGRVLLLKAEGLSVVSDIDDTIKVSQIPAGKSVVMKNTFLRDFMAAPGMADKYRDLPNACFHYVSGSPWQMYTPLSDFLHSEDVGFPYGTYHMKTVTKNVFSTGTWKNLGELVSNENMTYDQKVSQISQLFQRFPRRNFILVGDSGEKDPEVYLEIQRRFPVQVQEIWIRDVVDDRTRNPSRLNGMKIIPAETVVPES